MENHNITLSPSAANVNHHSSIGNDLNNTAGVSRSKNSATIAVKITIHNNYVFGGGISYSGPGLHNAASTSSSSAANAVVENAANVISYGVPWIFEHIYKKNSKRVYLLVYKYKAEAPTKKLQLYTLDKKIVYHDAKSLAKLLSTNKTLTWIAMNSNDIDDKSAKALAKVLSDNKNILHFDIRNKNISDGNKKAFADALSKPIS
eukprot:7812012-Ditylum_brightwellii.AAC.1